jgi:hypothetical protein
MRQPAVVARKRRVERSGTGERSGRLFKLTSPASGLNPICTAAETAVEAASNAGCAAAAPTNTASSSGAAATAN